MYGELKNHLITQIEDIKKQGLYKTERIITTPQNSRVGVSTGQKVLNLCANNYLGLAQHPEVREAAKKALDEWGYGMASVRFICGTQTIHKQLEERLTQFLGTEDTILYTSCWDANGGVFETILTDQDAVISDELNHASIIDGIRLCKAQRFRYKNNNMDDLRARLEEAKNCRFKLIVTDGVFSMDGTIANLPAICELADQYKALIMVDDSHAVGFMGKTGRGTHEYHNCVGRIDIITGTLGKALGGASGGYTSARKEIVDMLRQRSRPYLFSNTVPPPIVAGTLKSLDLIQRDTSLRDKLEANTRFFRAEMKKRKFDIPESDHAICPIMLYDAVLSQKMAAKMLEKGVYVTGFFFPVVPKDKARIRTQMSAAHTQDDLAFAIEKFDEARKGLQA